MKYFLILFLIALALVAYTQTFLNTNNTALSLTAYDLAEWLSLLPSQRTDSIPLLASLLFRIHLVIVVVCLLTMRRYFAHGFSQIILGVAFLLVIAQLPPLEFLANRNDINYQQQFFLASISLCFIVVSFFSDYAKTIIYVVLLFGILALVVAIPNAQSLMNAYRLNTSLGFGSLLLGITYIAMFLWFWQQKRGSSSLPLSKTTLSATV
jgi:hypothetical protein